MPIEVLEHYDHILRTFWWSPYLYSAISNIFFERWLSFPSNWQGNFPMQNKRQLTIGVYRLMKILLGSPIFDLICFCTRNSENWINGKTVIADSKFKNSINYRSAYSISVKKNWWNLKKKVQMKTRTFFCLVLPIVAIIILFINHLSHSTVFWFTQFAVGPKY